MFIKSLLQVLNNSFLSQLQLMRNLMPQPVSSGLPGGCVGRREEREAGGGGNSMTRNLHSKQTWPLWHGGAKIPSRLFQGWYEELHNRRRRFNFTNLAGFVCCALHNTTRSVTLRSIHCLLSECRGQWLGWQRVKKHLKSNLIRQHRAFFGISSTLPLIYQQSRSSYETESCWPTHLSWKHLRSAIHFRLAEVSDW